MWLVILIHSPVLQELQLASNIYMSSSMYESGRPETLYPNGIFQGKKKSMVLFSCAQDITCRNDLQVKRIQYYQTCPYIKKISTAHFWALIWRLPVHRNLETWHTHLSMSTCVRWIDAGKYWTDYLFVSPTPVYSYDNDPNSNAMSIVQEISANIYRPNFFFFRYVEFFLPNQFSHKLVIDTGKPFPRKMSLSAHQ
jgi:hypothetical protein